MKRKWSGKWRCWDSNYDGEAIPRKRFRSIVRHATGVFVTISPSCTLLNASISSESLFRAALLPRSGERPNRGGKQKGTRRHRATEKAATRERFIKHPPPKKYTAFLPPCCELLRNQQTERKNVPIHPMFVLRLNAVSGQPVACRSVDNASNRFAFSLIYHKLPHNLLPDKHKVAPEELQ